jgi:sulfite reductase alpha subunit-like flavoprotein
MPLNSLLLLQVFQQHGNMSKADADTMIREMQSEGRYVQELWA